MGTETYTINNLLTGHFNTMNIFPDIMATLYSLMTHANPLHHSQSSILMGPTTFRWTLPHSDGPHHIPMGPLLRHLLHLSKSPHDCRPAHTPIHTPACTHARSAHAPPGQGQPCPRCYSHQGLWAGKRAEFCASHGSRLSTQLCKL